MGWDRLSTDDQKDSNWENYMEVLAEPIPPPPKPDTATVLVDLATEAEKPKTYVAEPEEGEKKVFEKRKEEGFSMAPPVDVYEPGFRSDLYDAIVEYWKNKAAQRQKLADLKQKIGMR